MYQTINYRDCLGTYSLSHIPIIAVTAYAMKGDEEKAIEAGCEAYLPKPINTRELPNLVTEILLRRGK